jgi:hypothetical protein
MRGEHREQGREQKRVRNEKSWKTGVTWEDKRKRIFKMQVGQCELEECGLR